MGKSMQGATGAIILATSFNQILHNSAKNGQVLKQSPKDWLKETFQELNYVFQSFKGSMMVSCIIGLVGENEGDMFLINADHPNPILYRDKSASFLFNPNYIPRLGTGFSINEEIMEYTLLEGDVVIVNSDGVEDIKVESLEDEVVETEDKILEIVEVTEANLEMIMVNLSSIGTLLDDVSFIKISYKLDSVSNPQLTSNEYLAMPFGKVMQMVKNKEFERSLPFLLSYTQSDPENAKYWNTLGVVYFHLEKYLNAELAFSNAMEFSPNNKEVQKNIDLLKSKIQSMT
ncbi:MAG: SpoIIE family protein phosphatase [Leptospiraceae bacterium]|nr:SpoIIE family protein phosphatase [Leptospiraceae bacterium]